MKLLVLMGGARATAESSSGNPYPLWLTEIKGRIVIETILQKYSALDFSEQIFCVRQEDTDAYNVDFIVRTIFPDAKIVTLGGETAGAVCTALLAQEFIDNEEELLIVSIDDYIEENFSLMIEDFRKQDADVGLAAFSSIHPRYSFVKKDSEGNICEVVEKKPVSRDALASFYYFKHGYDFVQCAQNVIRKDNRINGKFYISQTLNEMLLLQKKFALKKIKNEAFHSLKTERQIAAYIANFAHQGDLV